MIWYVAYGSNLAPERFGCYLAGGRPVGGARVYPGCRDTSPALAERPVLLPGGIYFALTSLTWGGGMAFYDPRLPGRAAAHAYLLTPQQFGDVIAQEMRRDVGEDLDLSEVLRAGRQRLGPGRYETVLRVGEHGGRPMLTFTAPHGAAEAELNAPSEAYVRMLGRGIRQRHSWPAGRTADYLHRCPGVRAGWTHRALHALLEASGSHLPEPAGAVVSDHESR